MDVFLLVGLKVSTILRQVVCSLSALLTVIQKQIFISAFFIKAEQCKRGIRLLSIIKNDSIRLTK